MFNENNGSVFSDSNSLVNNFSSLNGNGSVFISGNETPNRLIQAIIIVLVGMQPTSLVVSLIYEVNKLKTIKIATKRFNKLYDDIEDLP